MLVTMAREISAMEHLERLRANEFMSGKVVYLLSLYEGEGERRMLEVMTSYADVESDGLALLVAVARQIVLYEGEGDALATLDVFQCRLKEIAERKDRRGAAALCLGSLA